MQKGLSCLNKQDIKFWSSELILSLQDDDIRSLFRLIFTKRKCQWEKDEICLRNSLTSHEEDTRETIRVKEFVSVTQICLIKYHSFILYG